MTIHKRPTINQRRKKNVNSVVESVPVTIIVRAKITTTFLEILDAALFVFKKAAIYVFFLIGEWLIVQIIYLTAGEVHPESFEGMLLNYITKLSHIGTFVAFVVHVFNSLEYELGHKPKAQNTKELS